MSLDAVIVALPHPLHAEAGLAVLERGLHRIHAEATVHKLCRRRISLSPPAKPGRRNWWFTAAHRSMLIVYEMKRRQTGKGRSRQGLQRVFAA